MLPSYPTPPALVAGPAGPAADGALPPATCPELEALRARLDRIDEELLTVVDARIRCCIDIARVKQRELIGMMQPQRIDVVQRRAAEFARTHVVDGAFLRRLYELMITETCRVEDEVIAAGPAAGPAAEVPAAPAAVPGA